MNNIVKILMERDGMTEKDAKTQLKVARAMVYEDEMDPADVLEEMFGLEPDYVEDLL